METAWFAEPCLFHSPSSASLAWKHPSDCKCRLDSSFPSPEICVPILLAWNSPIMILLVEEAFEMCGGYESWAVLDQLGRPPLPLASILREARTITRARVEHLPGTYEALGLIPSAAN